MVDVKLLNILFEIYNSYPFSRPRFGLGDHDTTLRRWRFSWSGVHVQEMWKENDE